ncbi:hypothetical protein JCM8547_006705 [Rhodosporidiobolus lusitaniae]
MEHKARNPKEYIPQVSESRVTKDEGDKVVRVVRFGEGPEVTEEIQFFPPTIAYFDMLSPSSSDSSSSSLLAQSSTRITNAISYGPPPAHDLLLTFTFSSLPHVSEEQAKGMSREELNEVVGKGVEGTIEKIRELVRQGKL